MSRLHVVGALFLTIGLGILVAGMGDQKSTSVSALLKNSDEFTQQGSPCPKLEFPKANPVLRVPQDFPTIQAAIDAAPEGAMIQIAPGTYRENLTIRKNVWLQGVSREAVLVKSAEPFLSAILVVRTYPDSISKEPKLPGVIIENLTIADSSVGVEVVGIPYVIVLYNAFRNNGRGVLALATPELPSAGARAGGTFICGNTFERGGIYAVPQAQNYLWIIGNSFQEASESVRLEKSEAMNVTSLYRVTVMKNTMQQAHGGHTIILRNAHSVFIAENTIDSTGGGSRGVGLYESQAVLQGNRIFHHEAGGVSIEGSEAWLQGNTIEGNGTSEGFPAPDSGVEIDSESRVTLVENRIVNNLGYGILVTNVGSVMVCKNNQVEGNRVGNYGWYWPNQPHQPSTELKQKCEGS